MNPHSTNWKSSNNYKKVEYYFFKSLYSPQIMLYFMNIHRNWNHLLNFSKRSLLTLITFKLVDDRRNLCSRNNKIWPVISVEFCKVFPDLKLMIASNFNHFQLAIWSEMLFAKVFLLFFTFKLVYSNYRKVVFKSVECQTPEEYIAPNFTCNVKNSELNLVFFFTKPINFVKVKFLLNSKFLKFFCSFSSTTENSKWE